MEKTNVRKHLYTVWRNMMERCYNESNTHFITYGGRGITVCKKWHTFENFYTDMAASYSENLQIDRVNNNKGYSPSNCCWSTRSQQARNKSNNRLVTYNGLSKTFAEWADILGFNPDAARTRIDRHGWSIEEAFETPFKQPPSKKEISFEGITRNAAEWSKATGIPASTIIYRLKAGYSQLEILSKKKKRKPQSFRDHQVTFGGETMLVSAWAKKLDIPYGTIISRFKSGYSLDRCFSKTHGNMKSVQAQ